jgi:5-methylcytosine-specific restriction protein A
MKNLKPKTNMEAMKIQTANIPDSGAFLEAIDAIFLEVQRDGTPSIDIISGELHRKVGGYPGPNHRMPVLCGIMKRIMLPGDKIISEPPSGSGATLRIRYQLPRGQC